MCIFKRWKYCTEDSDGRRFIVPDKLSAIIEQFARDLCKRVGRMNREIVVRIDVRSSNLYRMALKSQRLCKILKLTAWVVAMFSINEAVACTDHPPANQNRNQAIWRYTVGLLELECVGR